MIKAVFNTFAFLLICLFADSQATFLRDVIPVIKAHCTSCHKKDGAAPFSLETYNDVTKRASFILEVIENKYMPPYPADPLFVAHANANILSEKEISTIKNWIKGGKPKGKISKTESHPFKKRDWIKPDLVLYPTTPYVIPGDNKEKFKIFVIPTNLKETTYISAIEYIPGNARRSHHSRIMVDTSNLLRKDNGIDVGDSSEFQKTQIKMFDEFWKGWVPGNKTSIFYPAGMAKILPPKADLIINTHYAPGTLKEEDNFSIRLYFSKEVPNRTIQTLIIDENNVVNKPFLIPPDSTITFYVQSKPLPYDISVISVLPHMHILGKSFKSFAITPAGEVIPLIHIPKWQFNWQLTYPFKKLVKIPQGSIIYIQATYDNTANNLLNPYNPPQAIYYGWGIKNEMMNLIFEFVNYQSGDENISTEKLNIADF